MNQKGFVNIVLIVVIVAIVAVGGYFMFVKKSEPVAQQPTQEISSPAVETSPSSKSTGLPREVEQMTALQSFLKGGAVAIDDNLLPFTLVSTRNVDLKFISARKGGDINFFFDVAGNPKFSETPPSSSYSPNKRYVLELTPSDPDSFVQLWDLKDKDHYQVGQCGTSCSFQGFAWLNNEQFIMYGGESSVETGKCCGKFVELFDLSTFVLTHYSSRVVTPR